MRIINIHRVFVVALVFFALAGNGITKADIYNLSADWSDASNPNGVWTYYVNGTLGVSNIRTGDTFADPPGAPPIWTNGPWPNYEGWSKSNGSEQPPNGWDLQMGDIYGHTGILEILWTSPITGPIDVSGGVWAIRDIDRSNNWQLTLNGSMLTNGSVYSGDPYSRSNPAPIDILNLDVGIGDVLKFSTWANGTGDYIALDLSINAVPVPGAVLLGIIGLGAAGIKLRKFV